MRTNAKVASHLGVFPGLRLYFDTVIIPTEAVNSDDGYLAAWIGDQITRWSTNLDRPDGRAEAPEMIELLVMWLEHVRSRIRDSINMSALAIAGVG